MSKVWTIIRKEWSEVYRNKVVLWTVIGTPLIFVVMSIGTMWPMQRLTGAVEAERALEEDAEEIRQIAGAMCEGLSGSECLETYLATLFLLFFMLLPAILPAVFASYSVVGEKTSRTLEPLLATPITTAQLLTGKALAAVVPAVLATWGGVLVYFLGIGAVISPKTMAALLAPEWMGAVFVVGPLMAVFSVLIAMMISTRTDDPRTAQQISGLVVLPLVLLLMGQSVGLFFVNSTLVVVAGAVLFGLDLVLAGLAVALFERETILTRWK